MSPTALDLPSDVLKRYRPTEAIRRRKAEMNGELAKRRRRATQTARQAAETLRREFGASEIFVFGSLARQEGFTPWPDIDLAVRSIPPARFFEAVGAVTGMSAEFKVDLIDLDSCAPAIHQSIETKGKAL